MPRDPLAWPPLLRHWTQCLGEGPDAIPRMGDLGALPELDMAALLPGGPGWSDVQRSLRHDPEGAFRLLCYGLALRDLEALPAPEPLVAPDSAETPRIGEGKLNINIVSPSRDLEKLANHLPEAPNLKFKLIDEKTLFENPLPRVNGTYIQQLIKLYAFKVIRADYVLCLDADLIACSDFDWNDLIVEGKANSWVASELEHPQWWQGSKEILNSYIDIDSMKFRLAVTPNILSTSILKRLSTEINNACGRTLEEHLFSNLNGWTEYTLYSIYTEENGLGDQYHCTSTPAGSCLVDRFGSVWNEGQARNLEIFLQRQVDGIFRIYQSNSYVDLNRLTKFYG